MCINNALNNKHIQGQRCECPQLQNMNSLSRLKTMNYFVIHNIVNIMYVCLTNHNNNKKKFFFFIIKANHN